MIGKLKRTLKEKCPECRSLLQIREVQHKEIRNGIPVYVSEEFISCSNRNCNYTMEIEQKRKRRQSEDIDLLKSQF